MPIQRLQSGGLRLLALLIAAWSAGSCGGGDDVTAPPGASPVASVEVDPGSLSLAPEEQAQLAAVIKAEDGTVLTGRAVTWQSSDPAVAAVGETGMVTALAAGEAIISATSEGKVGSASVTVTGGEVAVFSVEVGPNPASVAVGQSAQLAVVLKAEDGSELSNRPVTWSTSDPAVATVTETGLVTGVSVGDATITATSEGKSGSTVLTVSAVLAASVEVAPASAEIGVGASVQLTATAKDAAGAELPGRPASWSTSDANVARVNPAGLVSGIAAGSATITATIEGQTASAAITVVQRPVETVEVRPNPASVAVQQNLQLTVTLKAADGTELSGRPVTWETSNQAIATVNQSGRVTGVAPGTATITARSEGKSGATELTVTQVLEPVATVEVTPNNTNQVAVQGTLQFTATLKSAAGTVLTGRAISWSSSNQAVATVNASGLARGIAPGAVTITATSEGKSGSANLTVTPITGVTRTWRGGTSGRARDWSAPGNWAPSGRPIALDTVRIPATANPAVLSEPVEVARLLITGGQLRLAGHRLRVLGSRVPTVIFAP